MIQAAVDECVTKSMLLKKCLLAPAATVQYVKLFVQTVHRPQNAPNLYTLCKIYFKLIIKIKINKLSKLQKSKILFPTPMLTVKTNKKTR